MRGMIVFFKTTLLAGVLVLSSLFSTSGQDATISRKRNALYFELLGQGGLYSINYDRLLTNNLSVRVGFSQWSFQFFSSGFRFTGVPLMVNYLSGNRNGHLEAGIGCIVANVRASSGDYNPFFVIDKEGSSTEVIGTATIGYRYL